MGPRPRSFPVGGGALVSRRQEPDRLTEWGAAPGLSRDRVADSGVVVCLLGWRSAAGFPLLRAFLVSPPPPIQAQSDRKEAEVSGDAPPPAILEFGGGNKMCRGSAPPPAWLHVAACLSSPRGGGRHCTCWERRKPPLPRKGHPDAPRPRSSQARPSAAT